MDGPAKFLLMGIVTITSRKAETEKTWERGEWFVPRDAVYDRRKETYKKTTEHTGLEAVAIGVAWAALGLLLLYFAF